jgi:hypothetical protein
MKKHVLGFLVIILLSFLISCGKDETLTLISYGRKEIHANKDFNIQPSGENAIWMKTTGATNSTIAIIDNESLKTVVQADGSLVTAVIPKNLYQSEGSHQLYLLDKKTQIKSNALDFIIKK